MKEFTPDLTDAEILRRQRISAASAKATHRHSVMPKGSPENRAWWCWVQMRQRCFNPNCQAYKWYGGRGITVCPEWVESYVQFYADMGPPPEGKGLDRIDSDGNYEIGNCRWATQQEQVRNQRNNRLIKMQGQEKLIVDWITESGLKNSTVRTRIMRNGGVVDASVFEPLKRRSPSKSLPEKQENSTLIC